LTCPECGNVNRAKARFCEECGARLPLGVDARLPATLAGERYEVVSLLGEGARKRVFRARDTRLGREVAVGASRPGLRFVMHRRRAEAWCSSIPVRARMRAPAACTRIRETGRCIDSRAATDTSRRAR
jgi:hypothetical protein